ncbi:hypothetical protein [Butyrivibrio sp. FC2001]|uniref:hypothetical protein n=1 Tax=Butyrivibrio sp. FC2001 TaxID=1280671 RepID=UPI00041FEF09|nr:hypothetical protein [Butyrivibrio sp. FC2001]
MNNSMLVKKTTLGELAKALSKAAEMLLEIEKQISEAPVEEIKPSKEKKEFKEPELQEVTIEQVRTLLAEKSQAGLTSKVKELLGRFGAEKLSAVKPEDYGSLYRAAQELK